MGSAPVFERVGVVGGGLMGAGIAEVCARAGCGVVIAETGEAEAASALERLDASLRRAVRHGRLPVELAVR